jgi:hypothetical protein
MLARLARERTVISVGHRVTAVVSADWRPARRTMHHAQLLMLERVCAQICQTQTADNAPPRLSFRHAAPS